MRAGTPAGVNGERGSMSGIALHAQYIEIYSKDADDPANAETLTTYAEKLRGKWPAAGE